MAILSKVHKPNNFESRNSLKLSFTSIRVLWSNVLRCESLLESNSRDILAFCGTNFEDSIDSSDFSVTSYIALIRKVSITHLAVYVKEGLLFARNLLLENSKDSYVFKSLYFIRYLTSFSFINHHLLFGTRSYLVEMIELVIFSNDLTQMANFTTRISDADSFGSSNPTISSIVASPPLGNSDVVIFVSNVFPSNSQQREYLFHRTAYGCSRVEGVNGLCDHLRDVPLGAIFKFGVSVASQFCKWAQVGNGVYIPHRKHQVKPHSSPRFSAACPAVIANRNHFFRLQ